MIKDKLENIEIYKESIPFWDRVSSIISQPDIESVEVKKYTEEGSDFFYVVSEYDSREFNRDKFEFHKKYIDLQIILKGEEKIYTAPVSSLSLNSDGYNSEKDIQFGSADAEETLVLTAGDFAVFYPADGHAPNCMRGTSADPVKKMVIKIPVG